MSSPELFSEKLHCPRTLSRIFSDIRGGEFQPCLSSGICGLCRWGSKKNGFFSKNKGHFSTCLAVTPIERCRCESGKTEYKEQKDGSQTGKLAGRAFSIFFQKNGKITKRFQKSYDIRSRKFLWKRWNVLRFFAYARDGKKTKSKLFSNRADRIRIFLKFFGKQGSFCDLPGNNPVRGMFRRGGQNDFFQEKSEKT